MPYSDAMAHIAPIGVFLISDANAYQRLQRREAESAARRLGTDIHVQLADNVASQQIADLFRFKQTRAGQRAIAIVEPTEDSSVEMMARELAQAGIGLLVVQRSVPWIEKLRAEYPRVPLCRISSDQRQIGRIQAQQFRALLPRGGRMLVMHGEPTSSAARDRLAGLQDGLTGSPIHFSTLYGDWSSASAEQAMGHWIDRAGGIRQPLQLVGAQNDDMAQGVRQALRKAATDLRRPDLLDIPVTGVDGCPELGAGLVRSGELAATVVMPPAAGRAVELAHAILNDNAPLPRQDVDLAPVSLPDTAALEKRVRPSQ